jgi:uncharacterized protein (TIGR02466 family)
MEEDRRERGGLPFGGSPGERGQDAGGGSMPFKEPNVHVLFPVPLLIFQLADAEALNGRLVAEVLARRAEEPGVQRSNRQGWHSENDLFARTESAQAELAREVSAMMVRATEKMVPELPKDTKLLFQGWFNVSGENALNAPHDHPGVFWSGCYYVQVPAADDPEDKVSGAIEFMDPRGSIGSNAQFHAPFTAPRFTVQPSAGTCLMWPAFMKHWVYPNRSKTPRITAAFNGWFGTG